VIDLATRRRVFAEEIEAVANLTAPALVEALATVPRERFVGSGPWFVRGDGDTAAARRTADADPRHVYHNYSIALDPERQLFNGVPSVVAGYIDRLTLAPGERILHVGAGTGYYTALMAGVVGPSGRVLALEVDGRLADDARRNLSTQAWVEVRTADGTGPIDERFDAVLVNTGVTHPPLAWLDALSPGGRMVLPLTATMPAMGTIGKGIAILLSRTPADDIAASTLSFVAIYSAVGLRDPALNAAVGRAMMAAPFPRLRRLRRDAHAQTPACWLHATDWCLSVE
jgi:protein-L-isoaspartate(D-aspartate) O-methyltransferase